MYDVALLGHDARLARIGLGLSVAELAQLSGIDERFILRCENGVARDRKRIFKLCDELGLNLKEYDDTEEEYYRYWCYRYETDVDSFNLIRIRDSRGKLSEAGSDE